MSSRNWSDDDELMLDLQDALRPTPLDEQHVEQHVTAAAQAAYEWRAVNIDLELTALLYDSDLDQHAPVRGRAMPGSPRTLVFGTEAQRVEIELSDSGIEGQLIPPEPGTVRLLTIAGVSEETTADELGCFRFPARRRGPIRIACIVSGGQFTTEWITA